MVHEDLGVLHLLSTFIYTAFTPAPLSDSRHETPCWRLGTLSVREQGVDFSALPHPHQAQDPIRSLSCSHIVGGSHSWLFSKPM